MKKFIIMVNMLILILVAAAVNCSAAVHVSPQFAIVEQQRTYLGEYRVTFYCNCSSCCGEWAGSPTASGVYPTANHTCACGDDIPFGTQLYVQGLGHYICEDRGVGSGCIDIYVNNHDEIPSWGLAYIKTYKVQ